MAKHQTLTSRLGIVGAVLLVLAEGSHLEAEPPAKVQKVRTDALGDPLPHGAVMRLGTTRLRHHDYVNGIVFSLDGKTLFSTSNSVIRSWDVATGKQLEPFLNEEGFSGGLCLAISSDGQTLASDGLRRKSTYLCFWDVATRKEKVRLNPYFPDGFVVSAWRLRLFR
jgi:WD40 repeat protein